MKFGGESEAVLGKNVIAAGTLDKFKHTRVPAQSVHLYMKCNTTIAKIFACAVKQASFSTAQLVEDELRGISNLREKISWVWLFKKF